MVDTLRSSSTRRRFQEEMQQMGFILRIEDLRRSRPVLQVEDLKISFAER